MNWFSVILGFGLILLLVYGIYIAIYFWREPFEEM